MFGFFVVGFCLVGFFSIIYLGLSACPRNKPGTFYVEVSNLFLIMIQDKFLHSFFICFLHFLKEKKGHL